MSEKKSVSKLEKLKNAVKNIAEKNDAGSYWDPAPLLSKNATYSIVFGERSNGKTFGLLEECLRDYFENGSCLAIVRRWEDDIKGARGSAVFKGILEAGVVEELSGGNYNNIYYYARRWYLSKWEDGTEVYRDKEPFAYAFALTGMEHDKGTTFPTVRNIFFDEFLSRQFYLPDEFVIFMNVISTIVRQRDDVRIFMAANSVNKSNPYATEMGLTNFKNMQPGDLDVYEYGESGLTVAIQFADMPAKKKPSDKYFAFNNPRLHMITGQCGAWEIALYPHLPVKYKRSDIAYIYFIEFEGDILQCEIVITKDDAFTYIHRKTTPIQQDNQNLVYTLEYSSKYNYRRNILVNTNKLEQRIKYFYSVDKIFYQDNEVGEIVRNYINTCKQM